MKTTTHKHTPILALTLLLTAAATAGELLHCTITPERAVLAAGQPETAIVKVALTGGQPAAAKERPAVNLALVIDKSSSMSGDKIERAKEAAIAAVERLDARDIVTVIAFSDKIETLVPSRQVTDKPAIAAAIRNLRAGGMTAIFGGVSQGVSELRKHLDGERINRVILLSDGQANVGPSSPAELGRLGAALVKESISVSSVGLGLGYNEDLMNAIAEKSDGNSYFVENSDDLPRVFSRELGDVLSVIARNVKLRVQFKNGATPVELIGRDGRIENGTVTVDFNQIYASQQKYLLIRTEFAPGTDTETRAFATATATFLPAADLGSLTATAHASVRFSHSAETVKNSVDREVVKEHLRIYNSLETDRAVELRDKGDISGADRIMTANRSRLEAAQSAYDLKELDADIQYNTSQQEILKQSSFAPKFRKAIRTENMQLRSQQAPQK